MRDIWTGAQFLHRQKSLGNGIGLIFVWALVQPENQGSDYRDCFCIDGQPYFERKPFVESLFDAGTAVDDGHEDLAGRSCIVVQGKTPEGHITLWLDPASGYLVRKAVLKASEGDLLGTGTRLPLSQGRNQVIGFEATIDKIEWEKVGDTTFP